MTAVVHVAINGNPLLSIGCLVTENLVGSCQETAKILVKTLLTMIRGPWLMDGKGEILKYFRGK